MFSARHFAAFLFVATVSFSVILSRGSSGLVSAAVPGKGSQSHRGGGGASSSTVARRMTKPPLVEENIRRKGNRQTHCHFGNQSFELEERWRPDLGSPFGVLYCVRCECVAVPRKKRVVAKTRCENIKNVCPKPTCEHPVLLPERCCKTCPGEDHSDVESDLANRKFETEDDEKNTKEFSVLLTGRGLSPIVTAPGAGRAYLTASKRHLHYSIVLEGLERPSLVGFLDDEGNILEEHEVSNPIHHVNGFKICGVWRKLPKKYRRMLQKEKLFLTLASEKQPEGLVGGKILRNMRINQEVFSSLLVPGSPKSKETLGGGGIAIISTEWNSIYLIVDFNGIFLPSDSRDVSVYVQLMIEEPTGKSEPRTVTSSVVQVPKVHPEYNTINLKLNLTQEAQKLLADGQLMLRLSAKDNSLYLKGKITAKVTCNVFQATMTRGNLAAESPVMLGTVEDGLPSLTELSSVVSTGQSKIPTGSAMITLLEDGTITYSIECFDLADQPVMVGLELEDPTLKDLRAVATVNKTMTKNQVKGSFPKGVQKMEMLLSDDLFLSISTLEPPFRIGGRIRQRLYADAFVNENPLILLSESSGNPSAVGQAWLAVDKDCGVHYALYVSGLQIGSESEKPNGKITQEERRKEQRHLVELQEIPPVNKGSPQQRVLQRLTGEEAEDIQEDVELSTLSRIKAGFVYLAVSFKTPGKGKTVELRTRITKVPIPVTCLPRQSSTRVRPDGSRIYLEDESNDIFDAASNSGGRSEGSDLGAHLKCEYESESFEDGAQWKSHHDHCIMCSCQRGHVVCDTIVCPLPPCENPVIISGECCRICPAESPTSLNASISSPESNGGPKSSRRGCYFEGDKKFHLAGTRWHPYIPPFGFSRCALCTCEADSLSVECKRITCPPLVCDDKDAFREHPLACCKQCPNSVAVKSHVILLPGQMADQAGKVTVQDILSVGGCQIRGQVYGNGDAWHPTVTPYGVMKCIRCHCKDGRYKCRRLKCPQLSCSVKVTPAEECCPRCLESDSREKRPLRRKTRERRNQERKKLEA